MKHLPCYLALGSLFVGSSFSARQCPEPTVIELQNIGDSKFIKSSSSSGKAERWKIQANNKFIQVTVKQMSGMAAYAPKKPRFCVGDPVLKVVDMKYPRVPLVVACEQDYFNETSYGGDLEILYLSSSRQSSFELEVTAVACARDHFICPSAKATCISPTKMCDGRKDCPNGEDEICGEAECGVANDGRSDRYQGKIMNGEEAPQHGWPWQVWLHVGEGACGGSIVGKRWIATAAHCCGADGQPFASDTIRVFAGIHQREDKRRELAVQVEKVIMHPLFRTMLHREMPGPQNDFCLLKLKEPLLYGKTLHPICLPQLPEPPVGTLCYATGWGNMKPGRQGEDFTSPVLREVDIKILSDMRCIKATFGYKRTDQASKGLTPEMICAGRATHGICQGDSGGPLACRLPGSSPVKWQLIGATSFTRAGRCDLPAVFARVRQHLPFIAEVLYNEGYSGWSDDRTVRQYDFTTQYSDKDFAVKEPDHTHSLADWEKEPEDSSAFVLTCQASTSHLNSVVYLAAWLSFHLLIS